MRHALSCGINSPLRFQSTHPLRGATPRSGCGKCLATFQSTHPLRGATSAVSFTFCSFKFQSTHPLRGATPTRATRSVCVIFQSTHPLRGATFPLLIRLISDSISIHAPLAGCDRPQCRSCRILPYFNPRTPCGVRLNSSVILSYRLSFQSTHPLRGATLSHGA